jgi:tRNA threonylcarbamoyladenosine modification (KEOPS) complex  Pcc1 subunit
LLAVGRELLKAHASVRFKLHSRKELDTVFEALAPETRASTARAKATLEKEGKSLVLSVEARDTVALRSALNAYLRWINSIVNVLQVLEVP